MRFHLQNHHHVLMPSADTGVKDSMQIDRQTIFSNLYIARSALLLNVIWCGMSKLFRLYDPKKWLFVKKLLVFFCLFYLVNKY